MPQSTLGARIFLSLIGLLLAAAGAIFTWLMWRSFDRASQIEDWAVVPCAILESSVETRRDDPDWPETMPQEFRFQVLYSYDWQGTNYESDRFRLRGSSWSKTRVEPDQLTAKYPRGSVQQCRVNPAVPQEAVLLGESLAPGYSLWFPILFFVGGLGIVGGAWLRRGPKTSASA